MLYQTTHITRHLYQEPVAQCFNELRLTPRPLPRQRVHESLIGIQPEPTSLQCRKDYFGNDVTAFAIFQMHDHFVVTATSVIEVQPQRPREISQVSWEEARDLLLQQPDSDTLAASEFVFDSPYVASGPELAEYARPTFAPRRPLIDAELGRGGQAILREPVHDRRYRRHLAGC